MSKLKERIKKLEEEIAKRPAKPLFGEARSCLLVAMNNSANVDDAIDKYKKLKKQIEILKGMIVESQMAKLCWCDKCCDMGRNAKKEREKLFRELDALVIVKELQNVKSTKKE